MTPTFERFLRRFEAQGRDKADGWSPGDFEGLSSAERDRARDLLLGRIRQGDTVDMAGIRPVADARVVETLAALYREGRFNPVQTAVLAETLWLLTGDAHYARELLRLLDADDVQAAGFAATVVSRLALPGELADEVAARLCDGRHEHIVLPLAQNLLRLAGFPMETTADFQARLPLLRQVIGTDPPRRAALIGQLLAGSGIHP